METQKLSAIESPISAIISTENATIPGKVIFLSLQRAFVVVTEKLEMGRMVELLVRQDEVEPELIARVSGKVVRVTSEGVGIEFVQLDPATDGCMRNIIAYSKIGTENIFDDFIDVAARKRP
jgi:hypothetical protein